MDLNNRQTGKDASKPRTLGLLGHSEQMAVDRTIILYQLEQVHMIYHNFKNIYTHPLFICGETTRKEEARLDGQCAQLRSKKIFS